MTKVKCHKCDYEWKYKGKLDYAPCPNCRLKTKTNKKNRGENEQKLKRKSGSNHDSKKVSNCSEVNPYWNNMGFCILLFLFKSFVKL